MDPSPGNVAPAELSIREAIRAEPGAPEAAGLEGWLEGLEERGWRELLVELRDIAAGLSPRYRDVVDPEDVIGELAVLACDRWLPAYLAELRAGSAKASLRAYLKMRLAGHLAEMRRKGKRRAQLLSEHVGPRPILGEADEIEVANAVLVGGASDPHGDAVVEEIVRKAGKDPSLRAVLALRFAGFSQDEIAQRLEVSRPTVSRRLAAIATAITVLFAALIALTWWAVREDFAHENIVQEDVGRGDVVSPAGGGDRHPGQRAPVRGFGPDETDAATPMPLLAPAQSGPVRREQIGAVVSQHRRDVGRCRGVHAPRASGRVDIAIAIGTDGVPFEVQASGGGDPLDRCIEDAVRGWRFPRATEVTHTSYPFTFSFEALPDSQSALEAHARECTMSRDNPCVIRLLEGRTRNANQLGMLIEAYRARGQTDDARRHMAMFVRDYPAHPRARTYQQVLTRR